LLHSVRLLSHSKIFGAHSDKAFLLSLTFIAFFYSEECVSAAVVKALATLKNIRRICRVSFSAKSNILDYFYDKEALHSARLLSHSQI
jgi:hypothetical protein